MQFLVAKTPQSLTRLSLLTRNDLRCSNKLGIILQIQIMLLFANIVRDLRFKDFLSRKNMWEGIIFKSAPFWEASQVHLCWGQTQINFSQEIVIIPNKITGQITSSIWLNKEFYQLTRSLEIFYNKTQLWQTPNVQNE